MVDSGEDEVRVVGLRESRSSVVVGLLRRTEWWMQERFIKVLETSAFLREIEVLEFYCVNCNEYEGRTLVQRTSRSISWTPSWACPSSPPSPSIPATGSPPRRTPPLTQLYRGNGRKQKHRTQGLQEALEFLIRHSTANAALLTLTAIPTPAATPGLLPATFYRYQYSHPSPAVSLASLQLPLLAYSSQLHSTCYRYSHPSPAVSRALPPAAFLAYSSQLP